MRRAFQAAVPALVLLAWPEAAQAQGLTCPPQLPGGCDIATASITERIVFTTPVVTTRRIDTFSTQIVGRLQGGVLFDQTFPVPFSNPLAQGGVSAAMMAITTAGGPGVVIAAPVRTQRTENLLSSASTSLFTLNRTEQATLVEIQIGFGPPNSPTVLTGPFTPSGALDGPCRSAIASLPSATAPVCGPDNRTPVSVPAGITVINSRFDFTHFVDEARETTETWLIAETWELNGTVVAIGTVHAQVQSALFDQGGRLLGRLPELEHGLWGEAYAAHVRHGGSRDTWGLAGGYALEAAPGVLFGFGVDHGWIDVGVPGAMESGELQLTEIGATARIARGPFRAALSGIYGFGLADTERMIVGASRASYDLSLAGFALDLGYALDTHGWRIEPAAGLDYVRVESDGFTETDTLGLVVPDHDAERLRVSAGLEMGRAFGPVELAASARYVAVLDGEERTLPVAFAIAPGRPLTMTGPEEGDSALLGTRAGIAIAPRASLTLGYDGRFGSGYDSHAGFLAFNLTW